MDLKQKAEYSEKINQSILEIRDQSKPIHSAMFDFEIKDKFFELASFLEPGSETEANELFGQIMEIIDKHVTTSLDNYQVDASFKRLRVIVSMLMGFFVTLVAFGIGIKLLPDLNALDSIKRFISVFVPTVLLAGGVTVAIEVIGFYRKRKSSRRSD